jgi:acetyl-CoA C-acetyltransferase
MINNKGVITSCVRTSLGSFSGSLKDIPATKLGAIVSNSAIDRSGISREIVDEVIMGNFKLV